MTTPVNDDPACEYLTKPMVRARYGGASEMWIIRKIEKAGFPAPVYLGASRPYWRRSDLIAWEQRVERAKPPFNKGHRTKADVAA